MIKVIIGLGNPGTKYYVTRHSIGFRVLDAIAQQLGATWRQRETMEIAQTSHAGHSLLLVKPQTFMNASGQVIPFLTKQGIKPEEMLVVHDELELPFGKVAVKHGGSARGHNGLKSIVTFAGSDFVRLRVGTGRPEKPENVSIFVLEQFNQSPDEVKVLIDQAAKAALDFIEKPLT